MNEPTPAAAETAPERVLPSESEILDLADVFGLLGDPGRMRILLSLIPGPLMVSELSSASGLSRSATSHALRLLRAHRVVEAQRSGRTALYQIADGHVRDFLELGLAHVNHTVLVHQVDEEHPIAQTNCRPADTDSRHAAL